MASAAGQRSRGWLWALLGAAVLIYGATALVRPMISYRALEIGLPAASLGALAAAFALGPLVIAIPAGRYADRRGETGMMLVGGAAMTLAAAGFIVADGWPALVALSLVLGCGHLLAMVGFQGTLARRAAVSEYDAAFGHLALAASIGQLAGPAIGGLAAADVAAAGISTAFAAAAVAAAAGGLIGAAAARGGARRGAVLREPQPAGLVSLLRTPGMLGAIVASLTVLSAIDIIAVYLPALGEARGIPVATVGVLLAIRGAASTVSRIGLGRLTAAAGRQRVLFVSMVIGAGSVAALPLLSGVWALAAGLAVAGFCLGIGQPLTMSWVAASARPGTRGTALSVRLLGNRVGQVAVPAVAGAVAGPVGVAGVFVLTGATVGASSMLVALSGRDPAGRLRGPRVGPGDATGTPDD